MKNEIHKWIYIGSCCIGLNILFFILEIIL
nr:MAG TPA: protein of unknown function (DUF5383) [Caudoviricetes sp.]